MNQPCQPLVLEKARWASWIVHVRVWLYRHRFYRHQRCPPSRNWMHTPHRWPSIHHILHSHTCKEAFHPFFFFLLFVVEDFFNCEMALESDVLINRCFFNVALCKKIMIKLKSTWKDMHLVERHGIIRLDAPVFQPRGMDIQHMHQTMQDTAVRVILPTRSIKAILKAIHATILSLNSFSLLTVSMWVKGDIHLVEGCH